MKEYDDKNDAIKDALESCENAIQCHDLHPTDKAEVYREIERQAGVAAVRQEQKNERDGVPERPQDIQESAASGRLDG